ncbi:MAG TPA: cytochrome C oxidase subunit IV family protein [Actinomycetota bacterium]|nr:cytochrome C oxidase subunit IV family protein [Actinomycetota bacterium]
MSQHGVPQPAEQEELAEHPGPRQYVGIAVVLAVVTLAEVAIYYVEALADLLVPFLIAFAVVKFALVALWFMHLRFDSNVFKRLFVTGIVLALSVFGIVLWVFFARGGAAPGAS